MKRALALAVALAACRASEPPAATVTVEPLPAQSAAAPSASASTATIARCPPFRLVSGAACRIGDAPCRYAEGQCACEGPPQCGGAEHRPPEPGDRGQLVCTPNDPHTLRPDGCEFGAPGEGSPCRPEGKVCRYGECAWSAATYTCGHGRWNVQQYRSPGPP